MVAYRRIEANGHSTEPAQHKKALPDLMPYEEVAVVLLRAIAAAPDAGGPVHALGLLKVR
jgi:hypothetical protein